MDPVRIYSSDLDVKPAAPMPQEDQLAHAAKRYEVAHSNVVSAEQRVREARMNLEAAEHNLVELRARRDGASRELSATLRLHDAAAAAAAEAPSE